MIKSSSSAPASHEHKSKSFFFFHSQHSARSTYLFGVFFVLFLLLLLFQIETLRSSVSSSSWPIFRGASLVDGPTPCEAMAEELNRTRSMLRDLVAFLPLKDLHFAGHPESGNTWFMSGLNDTSLGDDDTQYLLFPSAASGGRLLCLSARDVSDGARNSYGLAWPEALPRGATLFPGLTFVSDTYYDHTNLWHGLSAVLPAASWSQRNRCAAPDRWVLFHWGELRTGMSTWVQSAAEAATGKVRVEDLTELVGGGPACFERAVAFRHNEGGMSKMRRREVYGMIRCRARASCGIDASSSSSGSGDPKAAVRMSLLLRKGARAFKDEAEVIDIFRQACERVEGCSMKIAWGNNMTFCDQVKMMGETDVLISPHGAQLTNLFLMDQNSSVMEFYPKGWKEFAGIGQYVYRWMADWAGMRHEGAWRDAAGEDCPSPADQLQCFTFVKDRQIRHNATHFDGWTTRVLREAKQRKLTHPSQNMRLLGSSQSPCACVYN